MERWEPSSRWVRIDFGGAVIADTRQPLLIWEAAYPTTYAVPAAAVAAGVLHESAAVADGRVLYDVRVGDRTAEAAAWRYTERAGDDRALNDAIAFDWSAMDGWREEDEVIFRHPRDPHHRVDAIRSSRHVEVHVGGEVVADSRRPTLVFETRMPTRYYLPSEDVRTELLVASSLVTACPYKGEATYRSVRIGAVDYPNVVWTYADPIDEVAKLKDLLAFYDEHVDVLVDGERQERPVTPWS